MNPEIDDTLNCAECDERIYDDQERVTRPDRHKSWKSVALHVDCARVVDGIETSVDEAWPRRTA
jgi:hypothetical protein